MFKLLRFYELTPQPAEFVDCLEGLRDWFKKEAHPVCPDSKSVGEAISIIDKIVSQTLKFQKLPLTIKTEDAAHRATSDMEAIAKSLDTLMEEYRTVKSRIVKGVPASSVQWTPDEVHTTTSTLDIHYLSAIEKLRGLSSFTEKASKLYDRGTTDIEIIVSDYAERLIKNINRSIREVDEIYVFLTGALHKL